MLGQRELRMFDCWEIEADRCSRACASCRKRLINATESLAGALTSCHRSDITALTCWIGQIDFADYVIDKTITYTILTFL